MSELTASISVNLGGNLTRNARAYGASLKRLSGTGSQAMRSLRQGVSRTSNAIDKLGNRYSAMLTGGAALYAVKQVGNLEQRLMRLGNQAGKSDQQMAKLKATVYETANAPDIRVDPKQLLSAIDAIVTKTGDLDFAEQNIRNIGLAIQATGAEGLDIGELMAEFQKMDIKAPDQVLKSLDILNEQGKSGAFILKDLAKLGPRVITAYTSMGRTGVGALKEMGATLQVVRMATGSSEMAATAFEALLRTMGDKVKVDKLKAAGINVYEEDGKTLRAINEVMVEIVKKADGSKLKLSTIFDSEAMRATNTAITDFTKSLDGNITVYDQFINIQADGSGILRDSEKAAKSFNAAIQSLNTAVQKFTDNKLAEPVRALADAIDNLSPERLDAILERIGKVGAGLAGLYVANKALRFGSALSRGMGGMSGLASKKGAMGGALSAVGAQPVFVVNMPAGGMAGDGMMMGGDGEGKKRTKRKRPRTRIGRKLATLRRNKYASAVGRWGSRVTRSMPYLAMATGAMQVGSTWSNDKLTTTEKATDTASMAGGMAGALGGAKAGALAGAFAGPIGVAIGSVLGGAGGYVAGSGLAENMAQYLTASDMTEAARDVKKAAETIKESEITINVNGQASLEKQSGNTVVNTGMMMYE